MPDMENFRREMFYGEIKFFNQLKKYGFITEKNTGKEFFFLRKDTAIRDERIISHLPVSFSVLAEPHEETGRNRRAILVQEIIF